LNPAFRRQLALEAFRHTAALMTRAISGLAESRWPSAAVRPCSSVAARKTTLRYGENPHQSASGNRRPGRLAWGAARQLQGKELSTKTTSRTSTCPGHPWEFRYACRCLREASHGGGGGESTPNPLRVWRIGRWTASRPSAGPSIRPGSAFGRHRGRHSPVELRGRPPAQAAVSRCVWPRLTAPKPGAAGERKANLRLAGTERHLNQRASAAASCRSVSGGVLSRQLDDPIAPSRNSWRWVRPPGAGSAERDDLRLCPATWCAMVRSNAIAVVGAGSAGDSVPAR